MNVKIKKTDKTDATEILALQKLVYLGEAEKYNDFTIPPLIQSLDEIKSELDSYVFLKAELKSLIVGSVRAHNLNDTWHIGRLIVHPDYQRKGIGGCLLLEIEKHLDHANRLEIFTGSDSLSTIRLYERYGYQKCRTERLSDRILLVFMEKYIQA
ncbi:MAG: GNAT family N-acetyltransferase [Gammaproteobacteria bacterium]|nr:GNAT family N-acetyltransferase [Gammaproteobacteria bacterium]